MDFVLPPRCLACGEDVDLQGALCPACWAELSFITDPVCRRCGLPFEADLAVEGGECAGCLAHPPPVDQHRAVWRYEGTARRLVLGFKHGDRTHVAQPLAAHLQRVGQDMFKDADIIAPVPLHKWRLLHRRYNQAALLALTLAARVKLTCLPDLLQRMKNTPSQGGLNHRQRKRNVSSAFACAPHHLAAIQDRHIILVDDVFTTGATLFECAKVLRRAGVRRVDALSLCRVVK